MVMFTPTLRTIKDFLPDVEITVFGKYPALEVLGKEVKVITEVDDEFYDVIFLTMWSSNFIKDNGAWAMSHSLTRVGLEFKLGMHESDSYFQAAKFLGYEGEKLEPFCDVKNITTTSRNYIILCDAYQVKWDKKSWPYYNDLKFHLLDKHTIYIIEHDGYVSHYHDGQKSVNKYSIAELAGLIRNAKMFIGNDSGPSHIAAALGVPTYVIFGPTRTDKNKPLGKNVTVIESDLICSPCQYSERWKDCTDFRCMKNISVDQVMKVIFG